MTYLTPNVAVAYREHGGEPYHYVVLSYDERGRVEALLRYTENLGFDAVSYRYNSLNQVMEVRVSDPLHTFRTWYGYDHNGRVDSVWTRLDRNGGLSSGGATTQPRYQEMTTERPDTAEIVYAYTRTNQVESMKYVTPDVVVDYAYNHRKWLDSLVATRGGTNIFRQILRYDATGQITQQRWKQGAGVYDSLLYGYDAVQRLVGWGGPTSLTERDYTYDSVGNRLTSVVPDPLLSLVTTTYAYGTTSTGPNRLLSTITKDTLNTTLGSRLFSYNPDGAMTARRLRDGLGNVIRTDAMQYSYRGLTRRFVWDVGGMEELDWRYRYSASGEREQKRLYKGSQPDSMMGHAWVYYVLGGNKERFSEWHGQTVQGVQCMTGATSVALAPHAYIARGMGEVSSIIVRPNGAIEYVLFDDIGSGRAAVDTGGTIVWSQDYEPFGGILAGVIAERSHSFLDRETDRESDVVNLGKRQYESELGRFVSIDSRWEKYPGMTPYQYGASNPLRLSDRGGDTIKFRFDPSWSDEQKQRFMNQFNEALRFLKRKGIAGPIEKLMTGKTVWEIIPVGESAPEPLNETFSANWPWGGGGVIYWTPNSGLRFNEHVDAQGATNYDRLPAAMNLLHEAIHAVMEDMLIAISPGLTRLFGKDGTAPPPNDKNYPNAHEFIATSITNELSRKAGMPLRREYFDAQPYTTTGPTSIDQPRR